MPDITAGTLVKHVSLGVGKVVAVEPTAVHVFFPHGDRRYAAKLRWPAAMPLLTRDGVAPDAWLAGLTSFTLDPKTGRYALAANFVSHDDAVSEFLARFPQAFADPSLVGDGKGERASRWRAASAEWSASLGGGEGERLLADGDLHEVTRRALRVGRHVTAVRGAIDAETLEEALAPGDEAAAYFEALFKVTSAPSPARPHLEKLFAASESLGVERDLAWPIATLFPFVADPAQHVILLPKPACVAAARLGCDLRYKPAPNWGTYGVFRALAQQLLQRVVSHGARDLVDVEAFVYAIGTPSENAKARRRAGRQAS